MRVGVRHHLSTRLQIQDTHWEVGEKQAIDSGRVVSPLLPPVYNSWSFEHFTNQQSAAAGEALHKINDLWGVVYVIK